jgi:predicted TIM-barrel fold metal-dependent hydrolase
MARPRDIGVIDTLIGFRKLEHVRPMAAVRDGFDRHPAEYMFKDLPDELNPDADPMSAIAETLAAMDKHGIRMGVVHLDDPRTPEALRRHPDRFTAIQPADPNAGMDGIRAITQAQEDYGIRGVMAFACGTFPLVPLNDRKWYPIYAKCVELDLAIFMNVGVPGPRVPMMPQYVGHLDEICYDFPDLRIVMRHGAEPWEDLAVKLMLKWPNLYYSTSAFAPKYWPRAIIEYANSRGADKIIYGGYYPMGLELDRIFREMDDVPFKDDVWPKFLRDNAAKVLGLDAV